MSHQRPSNCERVVRYLAVLICSFSMLPRLSHAQSAVEMELIRMARQSENGGDSYDAQRLYFQILESNPRCQHAYHRLGVMAAERGELDQAIAHFRAAESSGTATGQLLSDMGAAYFLRGDMDTAEQKLRAALVLEPQNRNASRNLELLLAKRGVRGDSNHISDLTSMSAVDHRAQAEARLASAERAMAAARSETDQFATEDALIEARRAASVRRTAEARLAQETHGAEQALSAARAAAVMRKIAEARAMSENRAAAQVVAHPPVARTQANVHPQFNVPLSTPNIGRSGRTPPAPIVGSGAPAKSSRGVSRKLGPMFSKLTDYLPGRRNSAAKENANRVPRPFSTPATNGQPNREPERYRPIFKFGKLQSEEILQVSHTEALPTATQSPASPPFSFVAPDPVVPPVAATKKSFVSKVLNPWRKAGAEKKSPQRVTPQRTQSAPRRFKLPSLSGIFRRGKKDAQEQRPDGDSTGSEVQMPR